MMRLLLLSFFLISARLLAQDSVFFDLKSAMENPLAVKELKLKKMHLHAFPSDQLSQMVNLKSLTLKQCEIKSLPSDLSFLSELEYLNLSANQIAEIPSSISVLVNLKFLDLSSNEIKQLPSSIYSLMKMEVLVLYANSLEDLSPRLAEMKKLNLLDVRGNQLKLISKKELKTWLGPDVKLKKSSGCNC